MDARVKTNFLRYLVITLPVNANSSTGDFLYSMCWTVTYANVGIWDTYNNRNGFRYMVQWLETVEAAIKTQALETDGLVNQGIFILDMKGMTLNFFRPACKGISTNLT